uniref:HscB mitochondrial iron-sulfur cluster cochaperone n=1 Tax=Salmo trutta TaxID=8032 RepID=A0A673YUU7_SALTR
MLSLNNLRIMCTSQALQHSPKLLVNRQCVSKASSFYAKLCNNSITFTSSKDTSKVKHVNSLERTFCTASVKLNCWNCRQSVEQTPVFFCLYCNFVQPPDEGASFFQIMDCDKTFAMDTQRLQKTYLKLQWSLHPDNFSQKTMVRMEGNGYKSIYVHSKMSPIRPLSKGESTLELKIMHIEEGTDNGAILSLDEAQSKEETDKIGASMKEKLKDLTEQIDASLHKGELQAAKALLAQMKYFANIEDKVKEKLSELM